jgi:hypothetical protein
LIERAYQQGERMGLRVWCQDEAGPYQTLPYPGQSWQEREQPKRLPHEYFRDGTAKLLTLLHPASGQVKAKGVLSTTNAVLHGWLKQVLSQELAQMPLPSAIDQTQPSPLAQWQSWMQGLSTPLPLPDPLPPLRGLLIWDNLAGHKSIALVNWLLERGILPLYTPLGGSWLNMAESVQGILFARALKGHYPQTPHQIIDWLEATTNAWNQTPTAFEWGGKRATRRWRARQRRRRALAKSGACCLPPMPFPPSEFKVE